MKPIICPRCKHEEEFLTLYFSWNGQPGLVVLAHGPKHYKKCSIIVKVFDLESYLEVLDKKQPNNVDIKVKRGLACLRNSKSDLAKVS